MSEAVTGLRERKKAETRAALRAAAARLFLERGPSAVTVNDICEEAGVSLRTFFNYFESKEEVIFAWDRHLTEQLVAAIACRPTEEQPLAALRLALAQTLPGFGASDIDWRARGELLNAHPELRLKVAAGMSRVEQKIAEAIAARAGLPEGTLYPQLLGGIATAALRAAFNVWAPESGVEGLCVLVSEALDLIAAGLPEPPGRHAGRPGR
jgi:AcrR family transcriptional regulator